MMGHGDYSAHEGLRLEDAILGALRCAVGSLVSARPGERFYCFALLTTGLGGVPVFAAMSEEGLDSVAGGDELLRRELRWSHADSPYYFFADSCFRDVVTLFEGRHKNLREEPERETEFRLEAMVRAMRRADSESLFGDSRKRGSAMINVEVVPPDHSNVARAAALNSPEVIAKWLAEAAEPDDRV